MPHARPARHGPCRWAHHQSTADGRLPGADRRSVWAGPNSRGLRRGAFSARGIYGLACYCNEVSAFNGLKRAKIRCCFLLGVCQYDTYFVLPPLLCRCSSILDERRQGRSSWRRGPSQELVSNGAEQGAGFACCGAVAAVHRDSAILNGFKMVYGPKQYGLARARELRAHAHDRPP